jgi:FAD/FMN-containing dehydrogenase
MNGRGRAGDWIEHKEKLEPNLHIQLKPSLHMQGAESQWRKAMPHAVSLKARSADDVFAVVYCCSDAAF